MSDDKKYSKTDDDRAREAAENPLGTAGRPGPKPGIGMSWKGPATIVVIALIVLAIYVAVLA